MEQPTSPEPQNTEVNADLDVQKTRELIASLGAGGVRVAPAPVFNFEAEATNEPPAAEGQMTGKDYFEFFQQNRKARFNHDAQGRQAFRMMSEYMDTRRTDIIKSAEMAIGQMTEELGGLADAPLRPDKFAASTAEAAAKGIRDMYGIFAQSEDPGSPFFKLKSWMMRIAGMDDGDIDSQMRHFHEAREHNNRSYEHMEGKGTIVGDLLPEGYREMFNKLVEPKFANALSYAVLDIPEIVMSSGMSTPATAARLAMKAAPKAGGKAGAFAAWSARSAERLSNYASIAGGKALETGGAAIKAPFKAIYGTSQAAAQLGGDFAGNAVRNIATAEVIEAGVELVGSTVRHPAMGFLRSFGLEAFGELAQTAGADIVDRALGKVNVKMDALGATTLERLAAGTAKGSETMSREAQLLAKGLNASIGWAPSMSGQALKTMFRDGLIGGALGYANSREEGMGSGIGMGIGWGGLSGTVRHVHAYTNYTHQDQRVVDNFKQYVVPSFARLHGITAGEMAKRFSDHVQSFGDLRTSAIEMSHLSTLIAHETGLHGEGNVLFYFGNSAAEFDKVLAESNMKIEDAHRVRDEFQNLGDNPAMFSDVALENGAVKKLVAINSEAYRPTSGRHEIAHMLFRSVAEANGDMDHIYVQDPITGRMVSHGKTFSPRYLSTIFGASKDLGVMPDAGWEAIIQHYSALQAYQHYSLRNNTDAGVLAQQYGESTKGIVAEFRALYNDGTLDLRSNPDHIALVKVLTKSAEEAFAYYHSSTSNVFAVDKYVKNPAHRNMLRAWAENRAAASNSRVISDLELAGIEIRGKLTNKDGSIKLFDEEGNPAIETFAYDDGKVVRLKSMDTWIESVIKSAYTRGEVSVSTLDPVRQEALAKTSGKEHLFNSVAGGGMRLKSKQELDELSVVQSQKILGGISQLPESVRPLIQEGSDGTKRIFLERINNEGMEAIRKSGAFTDREFNELAAMIHIARQGAQGNPVFNVMNCTLLGATHQIRRGAAVFRLKGDDVPVTYRTFVPLSVEVYFKDKDKDGNPLRAPQGAVVVHSLDVAAENRRLTKMFKRGDVQQLWGANFDEFVKSYQDYVINMSGLNGPRVPSAELFRPRFGDDAERVRDIMYETFGGRKPKDASFINTPGNGYLGGADDPNRPFYTMRFDTMSDTRMHPTSWNARSRLPLFPYVPSAYEGITRNMMYAGFEKLPLAGGMSFLRDRNGFEIYPGEKGYNLFDMFGIKIGTYKSVKGAIDKVNKDMANYDEADLQPAQEGHSVIINGKEEELLFPSTAAFMVRGLHERSQRIQNAGASGPAKSISMEVLSAISANEVKIDANGYMTDSAGNPVNEREWAAKGITAQISSIAPNSGFDETVRIGVGKNSLTTDMEAISAANEAVRVSPEWIRSLHGIQGGKDIADKQIAVRLAVAERVSKAFRDGKIPMPSANGRGVAFNFMQIVDAMEEGSPEFVEIESAFDAVIKGQKAEITEHLVDRIDKLLGLTTAGTSSILPFVPDKKENKRVISDRQIFSAMGVTVTPALQAAMASRPEIAKLAGPAFAEIAAQHSAQSGEPIKPWVFKANSSADYNALIAAGGTPNEWLMHHETMTPGFTQAYQALIDGAIQSKQSPLSMTIINPVAKAHIQAYVASAKAAAGKDGPYRKSAIGEFGSDARVARRDGKRQAALFTTMANIDDPDIEKMMSQESVFRAIAVAADPSSYSNPAHRANDMAVLQFLIHNIQNEGNRYHHEIKTTADRHVGIRGVKELTGGNIPANGAYSIYSTSPSLSYATAKEGPIAIMNNVNHNTPDRFRRVMQTKGSMIKGGMLTILAGDPGSQAHMGRKASEISYIVSTADESILLANQGQGKPSTHPMKNTGLFDGAQVPGDTFFNPGNRSISPAALAFAMRTKKASGIPAMVQSSREAAVGYLRRHMSRSDADAIAKKYVPLLSAEFVASGGRPSFVDPSRPSIAPLLANLTADLDALMPAEKVAFAEEAIIGMALGAAALDPTRPAQMAPYNNNPNPNVVSGHPVRMGRDLARADAISGMAKILQAIQHSELVDKDSRFVTRTAEKWTGFSKNAAQFLRTGTYEFRTKVVGDGVNDSFGSSVMMLAGREAIDRLDSDRKDIMRDLGLLGKAKDFFGNEFDYLEISDSKSYMRMDKFGGRVAMIAARGLTDADAHIKAAVKEVAEGVFDGPWTEALMDHANSQGLTLKDIFSHDELLALYPGMGNTKITFENGAFSAGYYGSGSFGSISLDVSLLLRDELAEYDATSGIKSEFAGQFIDYKGKGGLTYEENLRRVIIHEIQHMIYHAEGWASIWDWSLTDSDTGKFNAADMIFSGPAALTKIEKMLGGSEDTPILDSFGSDIDEAFVFKARHMQHETSRILSFDNANKTIRQADEATATAAIERIIHAPLSQKMMRNVIPETIRWTQALDGTYNMLAGALMSKKSSMDPVAFNSAMSKLNDANTAVSVISLKVRKLEAEIKSGSVDPKIASLSLLREIEDNRRFMTIEDPSWSTLFDSVAPSVQHNLRTMSFRSNANVWMQLLEAHEDLGARGGKMPANWAQWHMVKIANAMGSMMYYAQPDEITARVTEGRARMTTKELSKSPRFIPSPDRDLATSYQVGKYIGQVSLNPRLAIPFDDNLFMIGGAKGSETFTSELLAGGTPNAFRLGMRMMSRAALLSHYVTIRDVGNALHHVSYSSRGWRIGADGKPEFVFSIGNLRGAEGWAGDLRSKNMNVSDMVNKAVDLYREFPLDQPPQGRNMDMASIDSKVAESAAFHQVNPKTTETQNALVDLIKSNRFINTPESGSRMNFSNGFALLAGLSKDGISVGIEDLAKAMGATIQVDSLVTMQSPVLNAIHEGAVPLVMTGGNIAESFRMAGVDSDGIAMAKLAEIDKNFAGISMSAGELAEIVAVMHDVPFESVMQAPLGAKNILLGLANADEGFVGKVRTAQSEAGPSSSLRAKMSLFINEVISKGENTSSKPLRSVVNAATLSSPGSGIMFLQEMLNTEVRLSWRGNEALQKLLGGERFSRFIGKYHDPATNEVVFKHVQRLSNKSSAHQLGQISEAVLNSYCTRVENLLMALTPLAEKVADHILKQGEEGMANGVDILADMYKTALTAALKDITSSTIGTADNDMGGPIYDLRRRLDMRIGTHNSDASAVGKAFEKAAEHALGWTQGRTDNALLLPAFGLIGGATEAFSRTASARARYLGTAGISSAPSWGLDNLGSTTDARNIELARGVSVKVGPNMPDVIPVNIWGQEIDIARSERTNSPGTNGRVNVGADQVFMGLAQDINMTSDQSRPGSSQSMIDSRGMDPAIASTIYASQRLIAMGRNILSTIEAYNNRYTLGIVADAIHSYADTGLSGSGVHQALMENPGAVQALALGDLSNDLQKAKAFLTTAYQVSDRPDMNVALANFANPMGSVTRWGGYGGIGEAALSFDYGSFRPLSQTSIVRTYIGPDGRLVLTSAFEGLADSRDIKEARIVDAITGTGVYERHEIAHKPTMVMLEGWHQSLNLFADDEAADGVRTFDQAHGSDVSAKSIGKRVGRTTDIALWSLTALPAGYQGPVSFIRSSMLGFKDNWYPRNLMETMTGETIMDVVLGKLAHHDQATFAALDRYLKDHGFFGSTSRVIMGDANKNDFAQAYAKYVWGAATMINIRRVVDGISEPTKSIVLELIKRGEDTDQILETLASGPQSGFGSGSARHGYTISALEISQIYAMAGNMFIKDKVLPALESSGVFSADQISTVRRFVDHVTAYDPTTIADIRKSGRVNDGLVRTPGAGRDLTNGSLSHSGQYGMMGSHKGGLIYGVNMHDYGDGARAVVDMMKGLARLEGRRPKFSLNTEDSIKFQLPTFEGVETGGVTDGYLMGYGPGTFYSATSDNVGNDGLIMTSHHYTKGTPYGFGKGSEILKDESARYYVRNTQAGVIRHETVSVEEGGALAALIGVPQYKDFSYTAPESEGVVVSPSRTGRSPLSSSVVRAAMVESVVSELRRAGQKSLDVAPAGHHLSYVGADPMMLGSAVQGTPAKDFTKTWNNRGVKTINRTLQAGYAATITNEAYVSPTIMSSSPVVYNPPKGIAHGMSQTSGLGTGKNAAPDQMAEFAPKKGYAWQRLPDGRIMINVTGDHLGYKLDHKMLTKRRPGYGFSLIEGLGWDQQNGMLIPMRINSHVGIADMLASMEHPMAAMFSHEDPAIMGQHIRAAQLNKTKGFHQTRGEFKGASFNTYTGERIITKGLDDGMIQAYLEDPNVAPQAKAEIAAQLNGHQAANGYVSMVLPAGSTPEQIRNAILALHMEPVLGMTIEHQSRHGRGYSFSQWSGQLAYEKNRKLPTKGGIAPGKSGMRLRYTGEQPGSLPDEILKSMMETSAMISPHLMDDIDSLIGKIASGENGYFLPDTERVLASNGDTGLSIASMFPGRPDLLKYSWDAKNMHGIKIWKRTIPKGATGYHAHVVQFDAPMMFDAEGGLKLGPKAIAFKTPEQANAFANRMAASRGGSDIARALAAGEVEVVDGPETPASPFMPDASAVKGQMVDGMRLRDMENDAHFVGDMDTPMDKKSARALARGLGANKHLRFTPGESLMMVGGKTMEELNDIVRSKINFGSPMGPVGFASKAMNAIIMGALPNGQKLEAMGGEDWFKIMKKAGVSGEEMRQTGLAALFINTKATKLTRMDVAEFLAATIPMLRRHDIFTSPELKLGAIAALGGGVAGGDNAHRIKGGYVMPYMPDSVLQTRMNQHQAISGMLAGLERLELTHKALVESGNKNADTTLMAIAGVNKVLLTYAQRIGMDLNELKDLGAAQLAKRIQDNIVNLTKEAHRGGDTFANLNYVGLETARLTMNDHIAAIRSNDEITALVGGVMPELVLPLRQMVDEFAMGTRVMGLPMEFTKQNSPYGWSSSTTEVGLENLTGQALDNSYGKFWGGYTSGYQHVQTHPVVRFADKYATEQITGYIDQLKAIKSSLLDKTSPEDIAKLEANQALLSTAQRVLSVRVALKKIMEPHSSQGHFGGTMPGGGNIGGSKGVHEIGHSRFSQSLSVSGLSIEGFADPLGFSGALVGGDRKYSLVPLAYPITLLEEIQSDFAQKIEGVGIEENMDVYLPLGPDEEAALASVPKFKEMVEKAAQLRAMANNVTDFVSGRLVATMMAPDGDGGVGVGSAAPANIFMRLQLDATDMLNRGILAVQVPGLLRGTGRDVKPPESLKASLRGKFQLEIPDRVPSMEFDHELLGMLSPYQVGNGFRHIPERVLNVIKDRMKANIESTRAWSDSFGRRIGGAGTDAAMAMIDTSSIHVLENLNQTLGNIMKRGQQQMAEQHAVIKRLANEMKGAGDNSDVANFINSLALIGERSHGDLNRLIGTELAGMAILDEEIAMSIGAYARGEYKFNYEAIARRALERIRAKYTDTKTFTGKTILLAYEEMLRTPAEERPFISITDNLSDPKPFGPAMSMVQDLASLVRQSGSEYAEASEALLNTPFNRMDPNIADYVDAIASYLGQGGCLYVRNTNSGGYMSEGTNRTYRVFRSMTEGGHERAAAELLSYVLERGAEGHSMDQISIVEANYHRHSGSLAGDFVKQVIEVFAGLSKRNEFATEASVIEAKAAELKKGMPEVGTYRDDRMVPASLPYSGENVYKSMQLQMSVMDSLNRGQRGVGIMDASWQLTRGHGLSEDATIGLGIGQNRRTILMGIAPETASAIQTVLACYERITGKNPSEVDGPYGSFLFRLGDMDDNTAGVVMNGQKFDHEGSSATIVGHLGFMLMGMLDRISLQIPPESKRTLARAIQKLYDNDKRFLEEIRRQSTDGPAFVGGKKNIQHRVWSSDSEKFVANGLKDASLVTMPRHTGMGGWGYITNYGLPQHKADIMLAGSSKKFRSEYSLDAFERPVLQVEGTNMNMLDPKTGKLIVSVDVRDEGQMKLFRERYLQASKYVGGNWMVRSFLKEWAPVGGYVDLTVAGSHASNKGSFTDFNWSRDLAAPNAEFDTIMQSVNQRYASGDKALVLERGHQLMTPEYAASERAIEAAGGVLNGGEIAPVTNFVLDSNEYKANQPGSTTVNPLAVGENGNGRASYGTPHEPDMVRALVATFTGFGMQATSDQVASYIMRMRHPVVTTLVHSPEGRTKEMDLAFRRKMSEGVFLLMAAGERPRAGQLSQTGFQTLLTTVKNREEMPISYAKNVLVDRLELPPLEPALKAAPRSKEDKRVRVFDREKAVELMKQGYPDTKIASHLGVSRVAILNLRKNAGVAPLAEGATKGQVNRPGTPDETIARYAQAKDSGTSWKELEAKEGKRLNQGIRAKIKTKRNASKPDGSNPMPTDSLSDPQHPNQIRPTESRPKTDMAQRENMEREMNE